MAKNCVLCGAPSNWAEQMRQQPWEWAASRAGWDRTEYTLFGAGVVSEAVKSGATYEKRKPVRAARVESDFMVPVLQSAATGIVVGILGGAGAGIAAGVGVAWLPHPALVGFGAGAAGLGMAWIIILREHRQGLWETEKISGVTLSGGAPEKPAQQLPVQVEIVERDSAHRLKRIRYVSLPAGVTDEQLSDLAESTMIQGTEFSRRRLPAGLFSPDQYSEVVAAMLKGGLLRYRGKGERSGVELTPSGRAFLRQYL